jgi:tRNA G18 (ribose-2'-O)-methylase SpoU
VPLPSEYSLVGDPPALERAGLFVAEGRIVVERLLNDCRFRVQSIAVTPPAAAALESVLDQMSVRPPIHVCDSRELRSTTGFDFHRGCLALAHRDSCVTPIEELANAERLLAIEGVSNPDNIGGLFRTAFAFGVDGVLLDSAAGDPLYRKAIRTSMAATLRVPFTRPPDWRGTLDVLRDRGFRIVALTPRHDAAPLEAYDPKGSRLVIAVGSEGYGLADSSLRAADVRLRIPIDRRADSLNVVVAAAIVLQRLSASTAER